MKLTLHAKPGSKKEGFELRSDGVLVVRIRAQAVDNKANERIIELLSDALDISKREIEIVSGRTGKIKTLQIQTQASEKEIVEKLL